MTETQKDLLNKKLWAVANQLRGKMNADEYRNYCLGMIFYKYLSEKMSLFFIKNITPLSTKDKQVWRNCDDATKAKLKNKAIAKLGYFLPPNLLFSHVLAKFSKKSNDVYGMILEDLQDAFDSISESTQESASQQEFISLFDDFDLKSAKLGKTLVSKNVTIGEIMIELNQIDFKLNEAQIDILGDAYEYMLAQFASGAGKKAGEFYTPQQVSHILAQIVSHGRAPLKSVYDPTCGSGSLLLQVAKRSKAQYLYGQELNPTTLNLARMNMLLHNVPFNRFSIKLGDTLEEDLFCDHPHSPFDAVVANPPFSAQWNSSSSLSQDIRFKSFGVLAPKSAADYAFILHMLHHLTEDGVMACVAPHGVLFRSAAEGKIRRYLIESCNYIDAIIGLPSNLFFGASIPTSILVIKRSRKKQKDILFIDASQEFIKVKNRNHLTNANVSKIVTTYTKRAEVEQFSRQVSIEEIATQNYSLNITRYINNAQPKEQIDINAIAQDIKACDKKLQTVQSKITGFCKELDIQSPFH